MDGPLLECKRGVSQSLRAYMTNEYGGQHIFAELKKRHEDILELHSQ